jgi:hypothetical protein
MGQGKYRPDIIASFWQRVEIGEWWECWPWTGPVHPRGYGAARGYQRTGCMSELAHRIAYELLARRIPPGLTIDHVRKWGCASKLCCNPLHMEVVTREENSRRAMT